MTIDTSELREAMRLYARATKKDEVAIVNRTARNFAIKVIQRTPKAESDKIESELKSLPERTFKGVLFKQMFNRSRQGSKLMGLFQGNLDKGSREALALVAAKFIAQRRASSGYIRRGWYKIARTFGASSAVSSDRKKGGKKEVSASTAKKANEQTLAAVFENMASGSAGVASKATQAALNATVSDMVDFAYRKMSGTAKKFSGRTRR